MDAGDCPACGANLRVVTAGDEGLLTRDQEHLRLLKIFHYVYAGVCAVGGAIPAFYLVMGILFLTSSETIGEGQRWGTEILGWTFVAFGAPMALFAWAKAVLVFLGARCMARRRRYGLCMVVAALCCVGVPLGTVLGVFTLIVLLRPSVRALWNS